MSRYMVRAALVATLLVGSAGVFALDGAMQPALAAPKISHDVAVALGAAGKSLAAKDFAGALTQARTAQALPNRTPEDDLDINLTILEAALGLQDYASATPAAQAAADSPALSELDADAAKQVYVAAFALSGRAQQWQKTIQYGQKLEGLNAATSETYENMAIAYNNTQDMANAGKYASLAIDAAKKEGKPTPQAAMQITVNSQAKANPQAAVATLEQMAVDYNSPDSWSRLIDNVLSAKGIKPLDALFLFRLKFLAGGMSDSNDYLAMADLAMGRYYPVEAKAVLEQGIASGKVTSGQASAILGRARTAADLDARQLGATAAAAKAAKSGDPDVKLAEDYFGYRRYADAEAAARSGIAKGGVKEAGEGQMILAQSLIAQGKGYSEAIQVLGQINTPEARARAAHLWSLYAQALQKRGSASQ